MRRLAAPAAGSVPCWLVRLAALLLASMDLAPSLLFAPASRTDSMADLWLYRRASDGLFLLNYLVQSNSSDQVRSYFLVFVPTIREIRDFYREM
eukprot:SAG31_NODE_2227_length_6148_cov_5.268309_11_plen_94_part_00